MRLISRSLPFSLRLMIAIEVPVFSGTSVTSAAVRIAFRIIRQTVVDYMRQIVYVEPACGNIRSYKAIAGCGCGISLHHLRSW